MIVLDKVRKERGGERRGGRTHSYLFLPFSLPCSALFFCVVLWCVVVCCCWLLVVGCWLLVVGCWLLVVGCWLLVVGCWLCVVMLLCVLNLYNRSV